MNTSMTISIISLIFSVGAYLTAYNSSRLYLKILPLMAEAMENMNKVNRSMLEEIARVNNEIRLLKGEIVSGKSLEDIGIGAAVVFDEKGNGFKNYKKQEDT